MITVETKAITRFDLPGMYSVRMVLRVPSFDITHDGQSPPALLSRAQIGLASRSNVAKLSGVTLTGPGGNVKTSLGMINGNQTVALIPVAPLVAGSQYTVSVSGVEDLSGNTLSAPVITTFSTGTSVDLLFRKVATTVPMNSANAVSTTAAV